MDDQLYPPSSMWTFTFLSRGLKGRTTRGEPFGRMAERRQERCTGWELRPDGDGSMRREASETSRSLKNAGISMAGGKQIDDGDHLHGKRASEGQGRG